VVVGYDKKKYVRKKERTSSIECQRGKITSTSASAINYQTYSWITPLCNEAHTHGRTGWNAKPFTRADLDSNLVNMLHFSLQPKSYLTQAPFYITFA
jgi:hypothetical protein